MNIRAVRLLTLLILGVSMITVQHARAQTRLGLHVTQEELNIWQQRAQNGPYKTAGDVSTNSPGDWTRILANGNALVGSPTSDRWDGTGLSTSGTCWTQGNEPGPGSNRSLGDRTRDAAFVYLITTDSSYLTVAKNNLLYEAGRPNLNFANSSIWCVNTVWDTNPFFDIAHWLVKLLYAYDYIRPSLVSGPNQDSSAVSTLDAWFLNMGIYWEAVVQKELAAYFSSSRQNNLSNFVLSGTGSSAANTTTVRTYCSGPLDNNLSGKWQNRMTSFPALFGQIGVMLGQAGVSPSNSTHLITMGKRFFMEWMQFAVFADGTPGEFMRGVQDLSAPHGWRYSTDTAGSIGMIADAIARTGDTSLYDYSTSNGAGSGGNSTAGGPKSLALVHLELSRYVNQTQTGAPRYAKNDTTNCSSGGTLIAATSSNRDTFLAQANLYYKSISGANNVRSQYLRTASGAASYPSSPETGGYCAYCGPSGEFPAVLFMFGQMEGKVWPYSTETQAPTVNLTASPSIIATAQSSNLTWTTTNASSCAASDGWTGTKATSGKQTVKPTQTTVYTLSCTGTGGTASKSVTVSVSSFGSSIGSNLANSSTLIAHSNNFSTVYPRGPEKLWDLDTTTEDGSTGNGDISSFWVEFDFGKLYDLTTARLFGDAEGNWVCQNWTFQHKQNQTDTYATAVANSPCNGNQWFDQALTGTKARFVRVTVFGNPTIPATQARELEIQGSNALTPVAPTGLSITLSQP